MARSGTDRRFVRFGEFEAYLHTHEVWKGGEKICLEGKPFQLLTILLEQPGELFSKKELHRRLWPSIRYGEIAHNLNVVMAKLRSALGDTPENPKYIETLSQRGYRFIAPVRISHQRHQPLVVAQPRTEEAKIRLAVLPFENSGPVADQAYFTDGLADEIIVRLGHSYPRQLGVIARTSSMRYRNTTKDISQIGRELGVNYILEGCVRSAENRRRITAHLINVKDQTQIWAESYDYNISDSLMLQYEAAARIARSLEQELFPSQPARGTQHLPLNGDALIAYLKGRHYQSKRTEEGLRKSIEYFEHAIHLDANYALAFSSLANSKAFLGSMGFGGGPPKDYFPQAKELALRAISLNDRLSECYTSLANIKFLYDWDWPEAERLLRRAIELNPSDSFAYRVYSYVLSGMRRHEEAIVEAKESCELDPLSAGAAAALGQAYLHAGQYDKAIEAYESALELNNMFGPAMMWLGCAYRLNSMFQEAIQELRKANAHYPENATMLAWLGETYASAGRTEEAEKVLEKLTAMAKQRYVPSIDFALVMTGLGQKEQAFEWLQKARQERAPLLPLLLRVDQRFDILREDRRYHDLINSIQVK